MTTRRSYFRCQYQIGKGYLSRSVESKGKAIPFREMMRVVLELVMEVRDVEGEKIAGQVALKGLQLILKLMKNSNYDMNANPGSRSKPLNHKQAKKKIEASERFDYEFYGIGGKDDKVNKMVTELIENYKKLL